MLAQPVASKVEHINAVITAVFVITNFPGAIFAMAVFFEEISPRGFADLFPKPRDRSRKSIFTSIAQAGDSGPQASHELSLSTLDARTLLLKVGAALFEPPANLSELSKRH